MVKARVLLMDDDPMVRTVTRAMLEHAGHEVTLTTEGAQAVEAFATAGKAGKPFDMVICDLVVQSGVGGKEAARQILALDPRARVVVATGFASADTTRELAALGCARVLLKPFTYDELVAAVSRALSGGGTASEAV